MKDNRVKLRVMGISYSPMQSGAFALLLAVEGDSALRIPVVIGPAEAQAIAMRLEHKTSPRPMTHDLFASFAQAFGIRLLEVFIYRFEDGIYSSEMTFSDGDRTVKLDARTSDAIAVAMRTGAPIYTTPDIVDETGIELQEISTDSSEHASDDDSDNSGAASSFTFPESPDTDTLLTDAALESMSLEDLEALLARLTEDEAYEDAARVSSVLNRRKSSGA